MTLKFNGHVFRTQRFVINPKKSELTQQKKEDTVNKEETQIMNTLAKGILARDKEAQDRVNQLAALQPGPAPACILEPTQAQKELDEHYEKSTTITTNVSGIKGLESFTPPPVLLAPLTKEERK